MTKPENQPTPPIEPQNTSFRPAGQLPKRREEALALPPTGLRQEAWWHRTASPKARFSTKKSDLPCFRAELHEPA